MKAELIEARVTVRLRQNDGKIDLEVHFDDFHLYGLFVPCVVAEADAIAIGRQVGTVVADAVRRILRGEDL